MTVAELMRAVRSMLSRKRFSISNIIYQSRKVALHGWRNSISLCKKYISKRKNYFYSVEIMASDETT
jgi:hypothetical protein